MDAASVNVIRVPDGGIQPQVAVGASGKLHLIYFKGDEGHGDVFYTTSADGGRSFERSMRVNSRDGSAIAIGNIRGAHLAIGRDDRPHVAWMGTDRSVPGPKGATPMVYTRLADGGETFEPERNLLQFAVGLDGGGTVAADVAGHVYVAWHAAAPGGKGETDRTVWVAISDDDGSTFRQEVRATDEQTGACGCCGMRAFADSVGTIYMLFRAALTKADRDMYLLTSRDNGWSFTATDIDAWKIEGCPMSSMSFAEGPHGVRAAWETYEQVYFAAVPGDAKGINEPRAPAGGVRPRKHPAVAINRSDETLLAWTEGMEWKTGGRVAWQTFDSDGRPTSEQKRIDGVPAWSVVAAAALPTGDFVIIY